MVQAKPQTPFDSGTPFVFRATTQTHPVAMWADFVVVRACYVQLDWLEVEKGAIWEQSLVYELI